MKKKMSVSSLNLTQWLIKIKSQKFLSSSEPSILETSGEQLIADKGNLRKPSEIKEAFYVLQKEKA